ncbi:MAG: dihydropteroate synthase [Rhodospirillales bacterium]|nr:dihydropteroate synthase [Rhodospirillales bacterium]
MPAASPGLPAELAEETRFYLRPVGLGTGGQGRRLAGGPLVFADCEVIWRRAGTVERRIASIEEIETWAADLDGVWHDVVASRLALLSAPRERPDGSTLERPLLMGVINATPDSFSDGGEHLDHETAISHGARLAAEGADILDIGGESARPGAAPVDPATEMRRVLPVLAGLAGLEAVTLSVDTRHSEVMAAALAAGATMINDITALTGDPASLPVAAQSGARVVLMHMQGEPMTMNLAPRYGDAALDVFDYLEARVTACLEAGIPRERIVVDPGIGFGKKGAHNLAILRSLSLYQGLGCPVLLGVSRKGLTGDQDRARPPRHRLAGSLATALHALNQGVQILRVHDVAETRQALDVWRGITGLKS